MQVPFLAFQAQHQPLREQILAAMARVYDSQWYVLGEEVQAFEQEYALLSGTSQCVGVANGLDALHLSLRGLGLEPGDEVLVPSNTYIASWLAVTQAGGRPVPVEPDPDTYNINPKALAAAITARTKAIMPVHLYGQACAMDAIMEAATEHGLWVVEDNAQAHLATWNGKLTGSFGHANATSFYPSKNLGALGDAGAITTSDQAIAQRLRRLRNYGSERRYYNEEIGFNSRLDELQAAVLRAKLPYLADWTAQRRQVAAWYDQNLAGIEGLRLPHTAPGATHVYHLYVVHHPQRDALQFHLAQQQIDTLIHYPVPPHLQQAYTFMKLGPGTFPIAEKLAATCLSLPLWPGMTEAQVQQVADAIRSFEG